MKKSVFLVLLALGFSPILADTYTHYDWTCLTKNNSSVSVNESVNNAQNYGSAKYYSNGGNGLPSNCVGKQTKQNYTMTIDNNGGSGGALKYNSDGSMYVSSPWRTGYTFTSWSTSNGNAPASKIPASFAGNVTYTANWKINQYTISVNGDGGVSGIDGNGKYDYGSQACLTYRLKTGYKLSKVVGTGPDAGQTWTDKAGRTGNIVDCWSMYGDRAGTVYTEGITYYVTYDANGGSNAPSTQAFVFNSGDRISSSVPSRTGYDFIDWTYGGNHFKPGDAIPSGWGSFTLTANWKSKILYGYQDATGYSGSYQWSAPSYYKTGTVNYWSNYNYKTSSYSCNCHTVCTGPRVAGNPTCPNDDCDWRENAGGCWWHRDTGRSCDTCWNSTNANCGWTTAGSIEAAGCATGYGLNNRGTHQTATVYYPVTSWGSVQNCGTSQCASKSATRRLVKSNDNGATWNEY